MTSPRITTGRAKFSAIVACYRDSQAVPFIHHRLKAVFEAIEVDFKIIFVNNASPDNAAIVLAALAARSCLANDPRIIDVEHTYLYSPETVHMLYEKAGLPVREVVRVLNSCPLAHLVRLVAANAALMRMLLGFLRVTRIVAIILRVPSGNLFAVAETPVWRRAF